MSEEPDEGNLEEVERQLAEIQRRKRGRIRWSIGKHTAEMAIGALAGDEDQRKIASKRHGKQRRRKRNKRML